MCSASSHAACGFSPLMLSQLLASSSLPPSSQALSEVADTSLTSID
jgi:hypothetical protein